MNERKAEMIRSIQPQIDAELPLLVEKISGYAAEHKGELREALLEAIRQCALKARLLVENGKKGKVCYIVVSLLASSFETGRYDLQIALHDEKYLLDFQECASYFDYRFLHELFQPALEPALASLKKRFTRCKEYEIIRVRRAYDHQIGRLALQLVHSLLINGEPVGLLPEIPVFASTVWLSMGYYRNGQSVTATLV